MFFFSAILFFKVFIFCSITSLVNLFFFISRTTFSNIDISSSSFLSLSDLSFKMREGRVDSSSSFLPCLTESSSFSSLLFSNLSLTISFLTLSINFPFVSTEPRNRKSNLFCLVAIYLFLASSISWSCASLSLMEF